jgi:hypothetical protein
MGYFQEGPKKRIPLPHFGSGTHFWCQSYPLVVAIYLLYSSRNWVWRLTIGTATPWM